MCPPILQTTKGQTHGSAPTLLLVSLKSLLLHQPLTHAGSSSYLDGGIALFDMLNAAFLVDNERGAAGNASFWNEQTILCGDLAGCEVAQHREGHFQVLSE